MGRKGGLRTRLLRIPGVCGPGVPGAVQQSPTGAALISKECRLVCAWKEWFPRGVL